MRKTIGAFLALFALVLTSACGASGGDETSSSTTTTVAAGDSTTSTTEGDTTTTTEAGSDTTNVDEWAKDFCGSFEDWIAKIQEESANVSDSVTPGDVAGAKQVIVDLFGSVSDETQSLIGDIENAGVPDIDDGANFVDDLIGKFQDFDDAIQAAKTDAEALQTADPAKFKTDVDGLVATFQSETTAVGNSFGELDAKYPDQDLQVALKSSCNL